MNVLMICRYYYPHIGGNENQCRQLSEGLAKRGIKVVVVTDRYTRRLPREERRKNVRVLRATSLTWLTYLEYNAEEKSSAQQMMNDHRARIEALLAAAVAAVKRVYFTVNEWVLLCAILWLVLRNRKSDTIIHVHQSHWLTLPGYFVSRLFGNPLIVKEAGLNGIDEIKKLPVARFWAKGIRRHACYVAVSTIIEESLVARGISANRVKLIYNGIDIPPKWKNPAGGRVIFVGNYWQGRIKGLDVLLEAWHIVEASIHSLQLIIIGGGDFSPYQRIIDDHSLKRVFKYGLCQNVLELLYASDLYVLPSRSEGMSNSLLEAASIGMPCISTDVSGASEILNHGHTGLIVPKEDPRALADAICMYMTDRRQALLAGKGARVNITTHFSMEKIVLAYEVYYRQLLKVRI
jgi:glycosyltransferase involved in cell wall biosynthesis